MKGTWIDARTYYKGSSKGAELLQQGKVNFRQLEILVIDEADRMLDMGFIHDVRRIIALLPTKRQSLFFSATMPQAIIDLAGSILKNPKHVEVTPPATTVEKIDQTVCHVGMADKRTLLHHLLKGRKPRRLETIALLDKPSRREVDVKATWTGFEIPDEFVVGYGIDYAQNNRNLGHIGKVRFLEE